MSELEVVRTADIIAVEINIIKNNTLKTINDSCVEIGRRLVEAKEMVPHGEWGTWLQNNVAYSKSTANNLMRIYEEYGSNNKVLGNLNYTQAVALLGLPSEEREQFVEENDINGMSTRDLQTAIKQKEEEAKKILQEKQKVEQMLSKAQANVNELNNELNESQKNAKELNDTLLKERKESQEEITRLQFSMMDTKKMIAEAQASGDPEEVKRLQESLSSTECNLEEAKKKIANLEKELKDKPIEASTVIEKIPEEIEQELSELRKLKSNESTMKFKVYFDALVKDFQNLLSTLEGLPAEEQEKYKKATAGLISKMNERL